MLRFWKCSFCYNLTLGHKFEIRNANTSTYDDWIYTQYLEVTLKESQFTKTINVKRSNLIPVTHVKISLVYSSAKWHFKCCKQPHLWIRKTQFFTSFRTRCPANWILWYIHLLSTTCHDRQLRRYIAIKCNKSTATLLLT